MKKLFVGVLSASIFLTSVSPLYANNDTQSRNTDKKVETSWVENGVEITVNDLHSLSEEEKATFSNFALPNGNGTNSIPLPDLGDGDVIEGPTKHVFDRRVDRYIMEGALRGVSLYVTSKIGNNWLTGVTQVFLGDVTSRLKDKQYEYATVLTRKVYTSPDNRYAYYMTMVYYTDSSFSTPSKVKTEFMGWAN
ncbi:hypothetical protein P4H65_03340 [Paenibacillus chitinolyticus]|uniref:hypothetical protein n=1 Tax=Paenibacillus chitinolyticus TaxID=79263 RepID=UPI002DBF3E78|nr:hypothetical protein [Paenibacillus chitinolyticus]MEC0244851.1 hypothetical protein [Paenibacillus chitinolyticus]